MLVSKSKSRVYKTARQTGVLSLVAKELKEFPNEVCQLQDHMEENEKFWECVDVYKIDMSHNMIETIPSDIEALAETLTWFKMSQNLLKQLPHQFFSLIALQYLDLSKNQLTGAIASELGQLNQLKELVLSHNRLKELPSSIGQLQGLEVLRLEENELEELPSAIGDLVSLRTFAAASNRISCVPDEIGQLKRIEFLDLSKNNLQRLPSSTKQLVNLKVLDIRQNRLIECPELSDKLHQLDQVFLGYNRLPSVPHSLLNSLKQCVTTLDLRDNQLQILPEEICHLSKLKFLDICNNDLSDLPAGLGYLKHLNRLLLDGNSMRGIRRSIISSGHEALKKYLRTRGAPPKGVDTLDEETDEFTECQPTDFEYVIRNAIGSRILALENRKLTRIPPSVIQRDQLLQTITTLNLSNNALESIELPFEECGSLHTLNLEKNRLTTIPEGLAELPCLEVLSLKRNRLTSDTTQSFFQNVPSKPLAVSLVELDLSCNELTRVPGELVSFVKLHTLQFSYNSLKQLTGVNWRDCKALAYASFSDNQLESIENIYESPSLISLNIENNNLRQLPGELGRCELKTLLITGNPQRTVRSSTITKGTEAILESLRLKLPNDTTPKLQVCTPMTLPDDSKEAPEVHQIVQKESSQPSLNDLTLKMQQLETQLEDYTLTQAKKYAVKKELAKVRSLKIRQERQQSNNTH